MGVKQPLGTVKKIVKDTVSGGRGEKKQGKDKRRVRKGRRKYSDRG